MRRVCEVEILEADFKGNFCGCLKSEGNGACT